MQRTVTYRNVFDEEYTIPLQEFLGGEVLPIDAEQRAKTFLGKDFIRFGWIDSLTSSQKPDTIALSEVLKKLAERHLYMSCLKIYDDGSGRVTKRTPDNRYDEETVFKFHDLKELWEKLNEQS